MHTSALLGRPSSVCSLAEPRQSHLALETGHDQRTSAIHANYELCLLSEDIHRALACSSTFNLSVADDHLHRLRDWANTLPPEARLQIRQRKSRHMSAEERRGATARLHTACAYYNSVITLTRPFLVAEVGPALHREGFLGQPSSSPSMPPGESAGHPAQRFPQACVGAAVYMLQMCRDASDLGLISGNMCILQ